MGGRKKITPHMIVEQVWRVYSELFLCFFSDGMPTLQLFQIFSFSNLNIILLVFSNYNIGNLLNYKNGLWEYTHS